MQKKLRITSCVVELIFFFFFTPRSFVVSLVDEKSRVKMRKNRRVTFSPISPNFFVSSTAHYEGNYRLTFSYLDSLEFPRNYQSDEQWKILFPHIDFRRSSLSSFSSFKDSSFSLSLSLLPRQSRQRYQRDKPR